MIDRIGPGGHYLGEEHTLRHFREVWYSRVFERTIYQRWLEQGARRFEERLRERTEKVMQHTPAPLPDDVLSELERMAQHWY